MDHTTFRDILVAEVPKANPHVADVWQDGEYPRFRILLADGDYAEINVSVDQESPTVVTVEAYPLAGGTLCMFKADLAEPNSVDRLADVFRQFGVIFAPAE